MGYDKTMHMLKVSRHAKTTCSCEGVDHYSDRRVAIWNNHVVVISYLLLIYCICRVNIHRIGSANRVAREAYSMLTGYRL
jgi:hypothetical protein